MPTCIYCTLLQLGKKTKEEVECWNDRKIHSLVIKSHTNADQTTTQIILSTLSA